MGHDYVCDERSAVPGCVQLPFLCSGEHDGNNHVSLVPLHGRRRQIQECCAHFRLGDLHCGIPLHPHLQLLGCRIPLCCRNGCGWCLGDGQPHLDWYPIQRCLSYMDWLLTVPLLLIEILLVMKLDEKSFSEKAWNLGVGSALMIASGYYGELTVSGDLTARWGCWVLSMVFFLYIVNELLNGLAEATAAETDPVIAGKIRTAQVWTVISWCTYPVVYLFPMFGINAAHAVVGIQVGYCCSDIISKCGVGIVIYQISYAKSNKEALLP